MRENIPKTYKICRFFLKEIMNHFGHEKLPEKTLTHTPLMFKLNSLTLILNPFLKSKAEFPCDVLSTKGA